MNDESAGGVNKMLTVELAALDYVNIVEVDNVCDSGNEILAVLRNKTVTV
jgi:hypothetical protein